MSPMKIGLLLIGTEILQGKIQDSHTQWLAQFLRHHQFQINRIVCTSDHDEEMLSSLDSFKDFDLLITSGGLGPTPDDKTKEIIATFISQPIVLSNEAIKIAEENYKRYDRVFAGSNHTYSTLPLTSIPLSNMKGFAPGILSHKNQLKIISLPGVPDEFRSMIEIHLPKFLNPSQTLFELVTFKTSGVPEEKIFTEIDPDLWKKLSQFGEVSSLPHPLRVDVGVCITALNKKELNEKKEQLLTLIKSHPLHSYIWHIGQESIEEVVIQKALEKKLIIVTAESCTGGLVANRLTNVSGSSAAFWGGIVSYDNELKKHFLGVKNESLKQFGAVSFEVAQEMAEGILKETDCDIAISLTGIAGPTGGSLEKPVGTVFIAIASKKQTKVNKYQFKGSREGLKFRFSERALLDLIKTLDEK